MSQQTPQSTRSPSRLVVAALVILAIVAALLIAFCPKPKPVPASTDIPTSTNLPKTIPPVPTASAPPAAIAADGPEKQDEGQSGKVTG